MAHIYKKKNPAKKKKILRYSGLFISCLGIVFMLYIAFPLISWQIYFEPAFAANSIQTPIPKATVLNPDNIQTLLSSAMQSMNVNYSDAQNWFPQYHTALPVNPVVTTYNISIPKLHIQYANVSTIDTDLSNHLIQYPGTALPSRKGNTVIFGHSTIPQWFNPKDYKTIFATAHTLSTNDTITVTIDAKEYHYKIISIRVTTPDDTTVFAQDTDDSYRLS